VTAWEAERTESAYARELEQLAATKKVAGCGRHTTIVALNMLHVPMLTARQPSQLLACAWRLRLSFGASD